MFVETLTALKPMAKTFLKVQPSPHPLGINRSQTRSVYFHLPPCLIFYSSYTDTNPFVFHILTSGVLFKAFRRCFLSVVFPGASWDDAVPAPRAAEGLAASLFAEDPSFPL